MNEVSKVLVDSTIEYLDNTLTESQMILQGSGYTKAGSASFNQGYFVINSADGAQEAFGYATPLINFASYSTIKLTSCGYLSANRNSFSIFLVRDYPVLEILNQPPWTAVNKIAGFEADEKGIGIDYTFDISNINESGYLLFGCCNTEQEGGIRVQFTKLELIGVPQYEWQSVSSVSGKNGILSLVTLDSESINDGEPVSGAAVSVFDQAPSNDNNIKNLADTYGGGEESSAVDVTVKYKVTLPPGGSFSTLKIVAKKDSIPNDVSDGDKIVDISPSKTKKTVTGLDENSLYYFKIFAEDTNSNTSESDEKHIMTSGDEGWTFDYTGEIQTFTAPKTGIYQLETWGAQGGNATDGTNTARGGYGAYAVGEVFLTQGDTLYINVGGQNGYGGGGNYQPPEMVVANDIVENYYKSTYSHEIEPMESNYLTSYFTDVIQYIDTNKCLIVGESNKFGLGKSVDNFYYSNANDYSGSIIFLPLEENKHITNVKFSYEKLSSSNWNWFKFGLAKILTDGTISDTLEFVSDKNTHWNVQIDIDQSCDFEANYIYVVGMKGTWSMSEVILTL